MFEANGHLPKDFGKWPLVTKSFITNRVLPRIEWKWFFKGR
jgi:hypothetical protein